MHIANKLLRIALLVKLAIKATDNSNMYNRAFPVGNALFLFAGGMMSLFRLPCGKLPLAFLAVPAGKDGRVECPCQTFDGFIGRGGRVCGVAEKYVFADADLKSQALVGLVLMGAAEFVSKEVHMRIGCPPLIYGCPFIGFTASKSDMELITRQIIKELEGDENTTWSLV